MTVDPHDPRDPSAVDWQDEPVDPDTTDPDTATAVPFGRQTRRRQMQVLGAIAVGGMAGSAARYGAGLVWPTTTGSFPWTTFCINVIGCALMGVLMVVITERMQPHPLVRPLVGTGMLGGFTTFSTFVVDTQHLLTPATPGLALLYAAGTVLAAVAAVWVGATLTRRVPSRSATEGRS